MVVGAQTSDVLGLVMKQGAGLIAVGVATGLVLALFFTRLMASLLFGIAPTDLATFASVTAVLFGVALAACYIPARRATKVDPIQTPPVRMRAEVFSPGWLSRNQVFSRL